MFYYSYSSLKCCAAYLMRLCFPFFDQLFLSCDILNH
nr:MAG TPA: hypothetical protein [Caudoviricetes sp.]